MGILVTGGAGFIGSFVVRALLEHGYDVVNIDNFDDFYSKKAKLLNLDLINMAQGFDLEFLPHDEVKKLHDVLKKQSLSMSRADRAGDYKFLEIDIRDTSALDSVFASHKIDGIIHLAAMAGVPHSLQYPKKYVEVNIDGTTNLLDQCVKYNIKNFVFASSSSVYGNNTEVPFREDIDVNKPVSPYAATKRMGEILNHTYHHTYGINISNLRFFTVYGPLQRPYGMAIQKFIRQTIDGKPMTVYGDGSMSRDFTYIDDIVDGVVGALEHPNGYQIYNLGFGGSVSLSQLTEIIKEQLGEGRVEYLASPPTEVNVTYADISLAKSKIGYNPQIDIRTGVARQIEIFRATPEWYRLLS